MRPRLPLLLASTLLLGTLSGCLDASDEFYDFDPDEHYLNPGVFPGTYQQGLALERGNLTLPLIPDVVTLESDRPHYGAAADTMGDDARVDIVMAIWRPDNYTKKMPVIVDAGPYYEQGGSSIEFPAQSMPLLLANFVSSGYAAVQIAVRGTGTSGGCMDLLGPDEAHDLDQAITWLGEQEWSNGNVAMMGVSYDGSTPWEVAGLGNPHLKTIVPISGLPDIYDLMFRNGSAETRGAIMHNTVYWGFGFNPGFPQEPALWPAPGTWVPPYASLVPPQAPGPRPGATGREEYQDRQNLLCPEVYEGSAMGQYSDVDGGRGGDLSDYWIERDYRQRVIDNYEGSIFLIHGLQDWNVDPHVAIPFNQELRDAGIEMKEWYGQWGHSSPDGACSPRVPQWAVMPCRLDYPEVLRRWFDRYLMENGTVDTGPAIQVQDNIGFWRNADSYPPRDADWAPMAIGADGALGGGAGAGEVQLMPPGNNGPGNVLRVASEPLAEDLHLSGMPEIRLPFSVEGQGGHIAAWLFDQDPDGNARAPQLFQLGRTNASAKWVPGGVPVVGHAQMNLRFHDGGDAAQPLTPGEVYEARIQFEPLEVRIPAGHRMVLWIFQYHYPEHTDSATPAPVTVYLGDDAVLRLPVLDVDPRHVFPVPAVRFPNTTYIPEMYLPMPALPDQFSAGTPAVVDGVADARGGRIADARSATTRDTEACLGACVP